MSTNMDVNSIANIFNVLDLTSKQCFTSCRSVNDVGIPFVHSVWQEVEPIMLSICPGGTFPLNEFIAAFRSIDQNEAFVEKCCELLNSLGAIWTMQPAA